MKDITDVEYNDDGQIIDCLSGSAIKDTPEDSSKFYSQITAIRKIVY